MTTRAWMTMLLTSAITAGWAHHAGAQRVLPPPKAIAEAGEPTDRSSEHYGWQILLSDAASGAVGVAAGSIADDGSFGLAVFGTGYVLGGPLVHLGNGHPGRALGSLALRVGLPALGVLLPLLPECGDDGACDPRGRSFAALGLGVLGMGVALVLDWTVLGLPIEEAPVERGPMLVPQVSAGADGSLQLGVLGRF